jgi:hypothetical protein
MNKKLHKNIVFGGIFTTLFLLPGCGLFDMFKRESVTTTEATSPVGGDQEVMTGEVLVTINDRPAITTDRLAVEKEKLLKSYPQLVDALPHMKIKDFERNLLDSIIGQSLADEYVTVNKINQTEQYKKELKEICKAMEHMLNAKFLNESVTVSVSDSEAKAFYDANRDKIQGALLSRGGVAAQGIEFTNPVDARAFVTQAKMPQGSFTKAAQNDNLTAKIKDFKLVNSSSIGMDEALRDKIVAMKTVPGVEMIEANGKYWVIAATGKEEPKYIAYDQIKDRLKQQLEAGKRQEVLEQKLTDLRKEYKVAVNEDYFRDEQGDQGTAAARGGLTQAEQAQEPVSKRLA